MRSGDGRSYGKVLLENKAMKPIVSIALILCFWEAMIVACTPSEPQELRAKDAMKASVVLTEHSKAYLQFGDAQLEAIIKGCEPHRCYPDCDGALEDEPNQILKRLEGPPPLDDDWNKATETMNPKTEEATSQ